MNLPDPGINLVPVIAAAVVNMAIGALWYSKVLFGRMWMKSMGKTEEEIKQRANPLAYVFGTIASLVFAYILAHIMKFGSVNDLSTGVMVGFWVWLGFVVTTVLPGYLYEGRSILLYLIFIIYQLFSISIMGAILAVWK